MATPLSSISGLVSGIDYKALVDQIIVAERAPADRLRTRAAALTGRVTELAKWRELLGGLRAAGDRFRSGGALAFASTLVSKPPSGRTLLAASAGAGATPGRVTVAVQATAAAEKLGGAPVADAAAPLGVAGEFLLNGARVQVRATDSLLDVRDRVNALDTGDARTGVTATVLSTGGSSRLLLASGTTGAAGIALLDTGAGVLGVLGFTDGTTTLRHPTSAGGTSDRFTSATTAIAALRGLATAGGPVTVRVAGQDVALDLATDTLATIAAKLDALDGVTATVQSEGTGAAARAWLDVRGTTAFADAGHALETLGLVQGGRGAVAQVVRGAALTAGDATTPATAATALGALWSGGAAAGVAAGDTLTISGTRGDGTAVRATYTVTGGDTLQDVLDALNDPATGFGGGARPATASLAADGRLQLTDGTAGDSRLALAVVTHNEGGGALDLGAFATAVTGRARQVTAGADAVFAIDGVTFTRASNTVTDALAGVTLDLLAAEPGATVDLIVQRDENAARGAADELVAAWNKVVDYLRAQQAAPAEGKAAPALYGDPLLRLARGVLPSTVLRAVQGAGAGLDTLAAAGFSLDGTGRMTLDAARFGAAFAARHGDLQRLFAERGTFDDARFRFVSTSGRAGGGTYAVAVTRAAARATAQATGLVVPYVDDATPDRLTVTDTATGAAATVTLASGTTRAQLAAALDAAFGSAVRQRVAAGVALFADAGGATPATAATTLASLHAADGTPAGVRAGDTIAFTGTDALGLAVSGSFAVTDPATQTLDDVATALRARFAGATATVEGGRIVVEASAAGASSLAVALTAQNQGGGALAFGAASRLATGRGPLPITAREEGGALVIAHEAFGAAQGFTVALAAGGADGTAQLGLAAGTYAGADVAGTIDGVAATGTGRQLAGAAGTAHDGLVVEYAGTEAAASGILSLVVGTAALLERQFDAWLRTGDGSLDAKVTQAKAAAARLADRADVIEQRLEQRRTQLLLRYTQMESAIARLQRSSSSITALLTQNGSKS